MYSIQTLNKISDRIYKHLPAEAFAVADKPDAPDAIIVRSADMNGTEIPESVLAIARAGAGYNNIPVDVCTERGVVVFNTPGANANAVKELVLAGILLSGRKVIESIEWVKSIADQGDAVPALVEKQKTQFAGPELQGKTLGVVGLGAIGGGVANVAVAFGMGVLGYDPFMSVDAALSLTRAVHRVASEEELYANSDYITIHIPLTKENRGKYNRAVIGSMKKGAVLVNTSRGEVVDDEAVLEALASGHLRAYVTDFPNARLIGQPGVIAIPHLGASTPESEENCADMAAAQICEYLQSGNITNSVNFPSCAMPRTTAVRLCVTHHNVPNMIGQITSLLATQHINIANMINQSRGSVGYTVIDLDSPAPDTLINSILGLNGMVRVRQIV